MDVRTVGDSAMTGWRAAIGRRIAGPTARHSRFDSGQVYAAVGWLFLGLSLWYVGSTVARVARRR
jgi:hypothetical protein